MLEHYTSTICNYETQNLLYLPALLTPSLDESFAVRKLRVNLKRNVRIFSQAEARSLAETYGGKLASEFNSKTSHVIMATGKSKVFSV